MHTEGLFHKDRWNKKTCGRTSKGYRLKKKEPFNTKVGQVCEECGFGSNPKELSSPLTKFDLKIHMYSHDYENMRGKTHFV